MRRHSATPRPRSVRAVRVTCSRSPVGTTRPSDTSRNVGESDWHARLSPPEPTRSSAIECFYVGWCTESSHGGFRERALLGRLVQVCTVPYVVPLSGQSDGPVRMLPADPLVPAPAPSTSRDPLRTTIRHASTPTRHLVRVERIEPRLNPVSAAPLARENTSPRRHQAARPPSERTRSRSRPAEATYTI